MLKASVAVFACLSLTLCSATETHNLRVYSHPLYTKRSPQASKDLTSTLQSIEERLRVLDVISTEQLKQSRRMDVIQDKLDRLETTLSLKLERAQLTAERLEHRLHKLQSSVEMSLKESTIKLERSQAKVAEVAQNLTTHMDSHRQLLEKVSGSYSETWRRGINLESQMRDGLSLINATRRDLVDGIRSLAKIHKETRLHLSKEFEAALALRLDNSTHHFSKMQEVLDTQKRLVDSCQRVQQDDPKQVADALDKLVNSLLNKTATTYYELKNVQNMIGSLDNKFNKIASGRYSQNDQTCKKLETTFRTTFSAMKDNELSQLTEKFVALTDRADAALQKLEARLSNDEPAARDPDVTDAADRLFQKLKDIKGETDKDNDDFDAWDDSQDEEYSDDQGDLMDSAEDRKPSPKTRAQWPETTTTRLPHRRHLHKHPYDRGPF